MVVKALVIKKEEILKNNMFKFEKAGKASKLTTPAYSSHSTVGIRNKLHSSTGP